MGKATKRSSAKSNGKSTTRTTTRSRKPKAAAAATNGNGHAAAVTREQIAQRAYEIWLAKGQPAGLDEQNWREAEMELVDARA